MTAKTYQIRIGSRASPLAMIQSQTIRNSLLMADKGLSPSDIDIIPIQTEGDILLDKKLADIGGDKGFFTKEIENALLDERVDIAVHSMKDMPTKLPPGLEVPCIYPRNDPRDVLIAPGTKSWKDLESGIKVGTASLRREAQLRHLRSDLNIVPIRGNVGTRLKKLRSGEVGALILALAGLKRLQCDNLASYIFPIDEMLPAIAQGALGVECREGDNKIKSLLSLINCERSKLCVEAERIFLSTLDGSCRSPIAGLAEIKQKKIVFTGLVAKQDGSMLIRRQAKGDLTQTNELGIKLGHELKSLFNP